MIYTQEVQFDQILLFGSVESFALIILKTILCLVLDFQGIVKKHFIMNPSFFMGTWMPFCSAKHHWILTHFEGPKWTSSVWRRISNWAGCTFNFSMRLYKIEPIWIKTHKNIEKYRKYLVASNFRSFFKTLMTCSRCVDTWYRTWYFCDSQERRYEWIKDKRRWVRFITKSFRYLKWRTIVPETAAVLGARGFLDISRTHTAWHIGVSYLGALMVHFGKNIPTQTLGSSNSPFLCGRSGLGAVLYPFCIGIEKLRCFPDGLQFRFRFLPKKMLESYTFI